MKLLYILAAIVAITLAEKEKRIEISEDSQAIATTITRRRGTPKARSELTASAYYYPNNNWQNQNTWQNQNGWQNPNQWQNQNTWQQQQQQQQQQNNNWANNNNWVNQPQNDQWATNAPVQKPTTTTTQVPVIKNEQYYGDNGDYKYEYQIGDGTHVGEEGYFTDPKQDEESLVKKGWYSYVGADGKTYTVTYWADKTGFHAYGDHLPTPPPVPAAIQAALDKQKEAEKNKVPQTYTSPAPNYQSQVPLYTTQATPTYEYTQKPIYNKPTYNPQQNYNPSQQYYPAQSNYYPQQQYPQQQYPQQQYPQQQYPQQQYPQQQYPQQQYPQKQRYEQSVSDYKV